MSFNRLSSLESQPPQYRDEPETQDDPEFNRFSEDLSAKVSDSLLHPIIIQADVPSFSPSHQISLDYLSRSIFSEPNEIQKELGNEFMIY